MSIPGDAPQNLLRPEAAEVTDELFANGWRGGSLDKAVPQINMPICPTIVACISSLPQFSLNAAIRFPASF